MTACGGNFIGGEITRNKQSRHEGELRRLSVRTEVLWFRGSGAEQASASFIFTLYNMNVSIRRRKVFYC